MFLNFHKNIKHVFYLCFVGWMDHGINAMRNRCTPLQLNAIFTQAGSELLARLTGFSMWAGRG